MLEGKINRSVKQAGKDLVHKIANVTVFTDQVYEPYVKVNFLKYNKETHYVEGSKTPTWNETFMMYANFGYWTDQRLTEGLFVSPGKSPSALTSPPKLKSTPTTEYRTSQML